MTRDIAARFNHIYGDTFNLPEAKISEDLPLLWLDHEGGESPR